MNARRSFRNKLVYIVGIMILILPMWWLGSPATPTNRDGGKLASLQNTYGLAQSNLGEIDPASETMKLCTLGFRGLAAQLLWNQAQEAKKEENWTQLTATLKQLSRLQPNFITFWKFQSWNISYNVSVQFDDYRDRYYYVREGIRFLGEGIDHNRENTDIPQLLWDLGWFLGQKIGRADEYVQYRRLFRADDAFHGDRPLDERDNWLVGKEAYLDAVDAIQVRGKSLGKKSEKIFYSSPAKSQMNYSEAIEEEGDFEVSPVSWRIAEVEWREFGDRLIEHSTGVKLQLGRQEDVAARVDELAAELEALAPGARERAIESKQQQLTDVERDALAIDPAQRDPQQAEIAYAAEQKLQLNDAEWAAAVAAENPNLRIKAFDIAGKLSEQRVKLTYTERYKRDANYDYWLLRAVFEQTPEAIEARRNSFDAKQAFEQGDRFKAKELYEQSFANWRKVLDEYPLLMDEDGPTGEDVLVLVVEYRRVLNAIDESFPESFPLWDVIEKFDLEQQFEDELREHQLRASGTQPSAPTQPTVPTESEPTADASDNLDAQQPGDAEQSADKVESGDADKMSTEASNAAAAEPSQADSPATETQPDAAPEPTESEEPSSDPDTSAESGESSGEAAGEPTESNEPGESSQPPAGQ